jgi:alkylated DNA repair dioxygenase AlkB
VGRDHLCAVFPPAIKKLQQWLASENFGQFNYALVNYYQDGAASIGAHQDSLAGLHREDAQDSVRVVSVSFGCMRTFRLKEKKPDPRKTPEDTKKDVSLAEGDIFLMAGQCQQLWTHEVPKEKKMLSGERYSITFRSLCQTCRQGKATATHRVPGGGDEFSSEQ